MRSRRHRSAAAVLEHGREHLSRPRPRGAEAFEDGAPVQRGAEREGVRDRIRPGADQRVGRLREPSDWWEKNGDELTERLLSLCRQTADNEP